MNKEDLRRLQVLEVIYNSLIEDETLLKNINEMYKNEVGEDININKEELMEVVEDIKTL